MYISDLKDMLETRDWAVKKYLAVQTYENDGDHYDISFISISNDDEEAAYLKFLSIFTSSNLGGSDDTNRSFEEKIVQQGGVESFKSIIEDYDSKSENRAMDFLYDLALSSVDSETEACRWRVVESVHSIELPRGLAVIKKEF